MVLDFVPAADVSYLEVADALEAAPPRTRDVITKLLAVIDRLDESSLFMLEKLAERAGAEQPLAAARR